MPDKKPPYDETKTTQGAGLLLKLNGRPMAYMKLVKLLYNIDREALRRWGRAITYDQAFSLRHGIILTITLDKAETSDPVVPTYWDQHLKTQGFDIGLVEDAGDGDLSEDEVDLITEWFERYKDWSPFDMEREHHNPERFPEWRNPGDSRIQTSLKDILQAVGYSESEGDEIVQRISEDASLLNFMRS